MTKQNKKNFKSNKTRGSRNDKFDNRRGRNRSSDSNNCAFDVNSSKAHVANDPHAANDLSWYVTTPEMLLASCSLPYSNKLSSSVKVGDFSAYTPGIAALKLETSICSAKSIGDDTTYITDTAINTVAKNIYSYIRRFNSGAKTYEAVDLMQYLLTCDQAFMLWSYLVRLYGIARTYQFQNTYYPEALMNAMGVVNAKHISENLAQLNLMINTLAVRLNNLAVPKAMPYFMRHMWLYQNVFLDRPNPKAQSFVFVPNSYYTYVERTESALPYLQRHDWPTFNMNTGGLRTITELIDDIMDPIVQSETLSNTIPGDILKAYGNDGVFRFAQIPLDFAIDPIYAEDIMPEISNLIILPVTAGDIKQTATNYLYQNMDAFTPTENSIDFISIPKEVVTPTR